MNRVIPVFIGSPGDVSPEREHCENAVHALAPKLASVFGVTLVPLRWEQFAPVSSADASHPQTDILRRIEPYSIFIGILWRRYGTPVDTNGDSGTEKEFAHALENRDRIAVLAYFRDQARKDWCNATEAELKQADKVVGLRDRLHEQRVWTGTYRNEKDFSKRITADLVEAALKMILAPEPLKLRHYLKFFRFGEAYRLGAQPIFIVYPSLTREATGVENGVNLDWQSRLLPRVVFEDAKALQDVEEVMRVLGRKYRTVTIGSPELNLAEPGDRVWICIPRNPMANEVLDKLRSDGRDVHFRFNRQRFDDNGQNELFIRWKYPSGKELIIRSPLTKYLRFSKRPIGPSEWKPLNGYTLARDYAVFARFKVIPDNPLHEKESYYHYFIGGVRGLGTWGAGWFIDHQAKELPKAINPNSPSDDVQILLEVTYRDYRIKGVRNVSNETQEFFDRRFSDEFIREELRSAQTLLSCSAA
jgi:hypothetical protein